MIEALIVVLLLLLGVNIALMLILIVKITELLDEPDGEPITTAGDPLAVTQPVDTKGLT